MRLPENPDQPTPPQPARVLLLSQALTQGGSERQLTATAIALDRSRFAPQVAVMRPGGYRVEELHRAGVPVTVFPMSSFGTDWLPQAIALRRFLRRNRIDIVHCFDTPSNVFAIAPARAAGVPVVLASQRAHRELASRWQRTALRLCDRLAHGVVVNCRFLIDHLVRDEGVPASKIHLCYNGLDLNHFQIQGARAVLPFPAGSLVIGTVCALREEKDLSVLVEAFAGVAPRWPQARLLIVGSGIMLASLQRLTAERGIAGQTHFEPSVADTAAWFRSLEIFVLPSRSEAFSNSLMEAMACGAMPVVSAVGGNPELVAPGRGLVFEVGDHRQLAAHLHTLLDDAFLRQSLAREASRWVAESLNLPAMAGNMGRIYEHFLKRQSE